MKGVMIPSAKPYELSIRNILAGHELTMFYIQWALTEYSLSRIKVLACPSSQNTTCTCLWGPSLGHCHQCCHQQDLIPLQENFLLIVGLSPFRGRLFLAKKVSNEFLSEKKLKLPFCTGLNSAPQILVLTWNLRQ